MALKRINKVSTLIWTPLTVKSWNPIALSTCNEFGEDFLRSAE